MSHYDVDNIDNIYTVCQLKGKGVAVSIDVSVLDA